MAQAPLRHGTLVDIQADAEIAHAWMAEAIRKVVAGLDKEIRDYVIQSLDSPNDSDYDRYNFRYRLDVKIPSRSMYSYDRESSKCIHRWNIGISSRTDYSSQTITMRKDGTVNEDVLRAAIEKDVRQRIIAREQQLVFAENVRLYEIEKQARPDDEVYSRAYVKLSDSMVNEATVELSSGSGNTLKKRVPIGEVNKAIKEAELLLSQWLSK